MNLSALGVTPAKEKQFNKKGIFTAEDLISFLPRKYQDFTKETGILPESEVSCVYVEVKDVMAFYNKTPVLKAVGKLRGTEKTIEIVWFNQNYMRNSVSNCIGRDVYVAGKVSDGGTYSDYRISSPELFEVKLSVGQRIIPVYSKIAGMSMDYLTEKILLANNMAELTEENCPYDLIKKLQLLSRKDALYKLHFPASMEHVQLGQKRMLFDSLLYFALKNEWALRSSAVGSPYSVRTLCGVKRVEENLAYQLTDDQKNAVTNMIEYIRQGKRTNALVQGDVGCGKSIVAFMMMVAMADSSYQSVLMAPTQVLARQHYEEISGIVGHLGYKAAYLGGSDMKKSEKKKTLQAIENGEVSFIVGTSSVVGKEVVYKNLALTITDEEHKFGVAQRTALVEKAAAGVHSITMSATPIPRSLAQVVYGNSIQLHTIKTMPHGRKPVSTGIATSKNKLFRFIINQAKKGLQTYVVCPMIDQSDDMEGIRSVEEVYTEYTDELSPYGVRVGTLTGKNTKTETEDIIGKFKDGEIDVLIATTVIEVGVNVPTATTMVITNAERFGLSSLHQLRGRVGRGVHQSYCVLDCESPTEEGRKRLEALVNTTDGFEIAEADLAIRGAGDFLGTRQSGDDVYMALMLAHPEKYAKVQEIAKKLIDEGTRCRMVSQAIDEKEI